MGNLRVLAAIGILTIPAQSPGLAADPNKYTPVQWSAPAPEPYREPTPPGSQEIPPPTPVGPTQSLDSYPVVPCLEPPPGPCIWFSVDYLVWWIKDGDLAVPLVTLATEGGVSVPGALDEDGTEILFGGSDLEFDAFNGFRAKIGGWITHDQSLWWEVGGFLLEQQSVVFQIASNSDGQSILTFPYFDVVDVAEDVVSISDDGNGVAGEILSGAVNIDAPSQLWGMEATLVGFLTGDKEAELYLVSGFRYLNLDESIHITDAVNTVSSSILTTVDERFDTRNHFFGGHLGLLIRFQNDTWFLDLKGQVAAGSTVRVLDIKGQTTVSGSGSTPGTFPGGVFTQATNIGRTTSSDFSVVPSFQAKLACRIRPWLQVLVAYDFLYWTQVFRPGPQIDRSLNLTQNPVLGAGTLSGNPRPMRLDKTSSFWAQGLTFGVKFGF